MLKAYAGTSCLVSLYTPDANSVEAATRMRQARAVLILTPFVELELTNALHLRLFRRELKAAEAAASYRAFQHDIAAGVFSLQPVPAAAYEQAKRLARKYTPALGVRTLDILHVATALALRAEAFWTFDANQRKLSKAVGFAASAVKV